MIAARAGRTAVLGVGNPVLSDDRVGLAVIDELRNLLEERPAAGVDLLTTTRGGLDIIDLLTGYSRAIIVDCLNVSDPEPGRTRRLRLDDIEARAMRCSAHEVGIAEAFRVAERLGIDMPSNVELYGVEGGDLTTLSESMTPLVTSAVSLVAHEIHRSLTAFRAPSG